jgi:MscS family membrane protein
LRERHRFLLDSLRLAAALNVDFAFPTQTLYLRNEEYQGPAEGLPLSEAEQRGKAAAERIVADTTGTGVRPPPVSLP